MVRHTVVDGNRVENHVEANDVIMGSVASRKEKANFQTPKNTNQNVVQTVAADDAELNNTNQNVVQTVVADDAELHNTNNELESSNMALNTQTEEISMAAQNSNLINTPIAAVVTETTTIINQKAIKSALKKDEKDEAEDDDLTIWAPPAPTSHVVVRTYTPTEIDELNVAVGDLIGVEKTYDDGWAKVQNITQHRKRGMLPLAIITPLKSGPTQTVIKSAGGIWKTGASTSAKILDTEEINYRETSLYYRKESRVSLQKKVSFSSDIMNISDDE
jgi:hypothetical protein